MPYPNSTPLSLLLLVPSVPTFHPHPHSPFPTLPSLSLCLAASSSRNVFLLLLVNCDPTLKTSSNVNSEISSFLGISSPYPQAELSSSFLCTPLTLAFAYTNVALDTSHYYKIYMVSPVPLVLYLPACVHLLY